MLCVDLMTIFYQGRDPFIQGFMKSAFRSITVASFGLVLLEMALSVDFVENGLEKLLLLVVEKVKRARWDGRDRNMKWKLMLTVALRLSLLFKSE